MWSAGLMARAWTRIVIRDLPGVGMGKGAMVKGWADLEGRMAAVLVGVAIVLGWMMAVLVEWYVRKGELVN